MRSISVDPYSRENFMIMYKIVGELISRHHKNDRLHLLSYINKDRGYYMVYLSQDPANPLSSSFGYFNASLGNFRSQFDSEIYYYFSDYKHGKSIDEIVDKIEQMIKLPYHNEVIESAECEFDDTYVLSVRVLVELIAQMAHMEEGFAVENEICPYFGPYSRTPDNRMWFDLKRVIEPQGVSLQARCSYDFFVVGTGTPLGPVYKPWAIFGNSGYVYFMDREPIHLPTSFEACHDYAEIARLIIENIPSLKPVAI